MKAVVYTRISTEYQEEGHSPEEQLRRCKAQLDLQEHEFVNHYHDTGTGSSFEKRPAYLEMMANAGTEYNLIIAYKVDRLHRNLRNMVLWLDDLRDLEVDFASATEPVDTTTAGGTAFLQMLGVFAEMERRQISDRVKMGMAGAKHKGRWIGTPPFGYAINAEFKTDGTREAVGQLIPEPSEARAVRKILIEYAHGASISEIITTLVESGLRTRTGKLTWHRSTIEAIIERMPLYVAGAVQGKPGRQPEIIDMAEYPVLSNFIDMTGEEQDAIISFVPRPLATRRTYVGPIIPASTEANDSNGNPEVAVFEEE